MELIRPAARLHSINSIPPSGYITVLQFNPLELKKTVQLHLFIKAMIFLKLNDLNFYQKIKIDLMISS